MNWNNIKDVDVEQIRTNLDLNSLEYLVNHIAFGNITDADRKRFADPAALKAFQLLQLGVEYLIHLKRPLPTQPDSGELKKALSQSQRRVEELEALLYESEMKRERAQASSRIYKQRYQSLQRQIDDEGEDDGEVKGIDNKDYDPFASVQKEINGLRALVEQRGKNIEQRTDQWRTKSHFQAERSMNPQQIQDLFKVPDQKKKNKSSTHRYMQYNDQGSLPT